jgi:hypothetical protein
MHGGSVVKPNCEKTVLEARQAADMRSFGYLFGQLLFGMVSAVHAHTFCCLQLLFVDLIRLRSHCRRRPS